MSEKTSVRLLLVPASQPVQTILEDQIRVLGLPYRIDAAYTLLDFVEQRDGLNFDVLLLNCTDGKLKSLEIINRLQSLPTILLVDGNAVENVKSALRQGSCPCLLDIADVNSLNLLPDFVERLMDCFAHHSHKDLEERLEQRAAILKATNWELHQEIGQRAAAEQAVHEEHDRFLTLVETIPHGIVEIDTNWIIIFANAEYHRMLGYPKGSLIGKSLWDILKPDPSDARQFFEKALREHPVPVGYLSRRLTMTGKYIDLKVDWEYKRDAEGNIMGFDVVITEVTQQRRAEEEARQRLDQLAHVTRMFTMSQMVSGLAHELNQPLAAIANFAQACQYRLRKSSVKNRKTLLESIGQISLQADRAGQIIRRLRDFVRRADSSHSQENINDLVGDVLGLLEIEARAHNIQLEKTLAGDLPRVAVDRIQIEQVITNLVKNALDATRDLAPDRRRVIVRTEMNVEGMLEVSVTDAGKGIKAKELNRVFEPFYTTKQSGMGLGLSISRSIVEAHGGHLEATRNAHRGMTFRFALPIAAQGGKA
jgi:PAS domain S-box-containing protein